LRGIGTYSGQLISGNPDQFDTIVYRTVWQGTVDFDTEAPTVTIAAKATKLKRPRGTYSLRVTLRAQGDDVKYELRVSTASTLLELRNGSTRSGQANLKLAIKPGRARTVQLVVAASDAVGNETKATRSVKLR
jgi:hypothetical protein